MKIGMAAIACIILSVSAQASSSRGDWSDVEKALNGKIEGGNFDGIRAVSVESSNQTIVFDLPLDTEIPLQEFSPQPVTGLPGAMISYQKGFGGPTNFKLEIPAKYFVSKSRLPVCDELPSGEPLPFMPASEIRGISLPLLPDTATLHLYFGANAVASFIELPSIPETPWIPRYMGFPVKSAASTFPGFFAQYSRRDYDSAGLYIATRVSDDTALLITELLNEQR